MISVWYHGTNESSAVNICNYGINFSRSKKELDFGVGFYLTDDIEVARRRALRKTKGYNRIYKCSESPAIVSVIIDMELLTGKVVKKFDFCNEEWLHFILANRLSEEYLESHIELEHNRDLRYDIVIGSIADSDVSELVSHIDKGDIEFYDISVCAVLTDEGRTLGTQMSLHTDNSLECVVKKEYEIFTERGN